MKTIRTFQGTSYTSDDLISAYHDCVKGDKPYSFITDLCGKCYNFTLGDGNRIGTKRIFEMMLLNKGKQADPFTCTIYLRDVLKEAGFTQV